MARTYKADGLLVSHVVRGGLIILSFILFNINVISWGTFFIFLFLSIITGGIIGNHVTQTKRKRAKDHKLKRKINSVQMSRINNDNDLINADVNTLSGTDFERLMAMYYQDQGYKVDIIGGSGDHEVDLILRDKKGYKIAVQCKRWKKSVGNDIVLRLKAGKQFHNCYDAWIVTTSSFTKSAIEAAEKLNVKLINGLMLEKKLEKWRESRII